MAGLTVVVLKRKVTLPPQLIGSRAVALGILEVAPVGPPRPQLCGPLVALGGLESMMMTSLPNLFTIFHCFNL